MDFKSDFKDAVLGCWQSKGLALLNIHSLDANQNNKEAGRRFEAVLSALDNAGLQYAFLGAVKYSDNSAPQVWIALLPEAVESAREEVVNYFKKHKYSYAVTY